MTKTQHPTPLNGFLIRGARHLSLRQPKFAIEKTSLGLTAGVVFQNAVTPVTRHRAMRRFRGFGPGRGGLSLRFVKGSRFGESASTSTNSLTDTSRLRASENSVWSVGLPLPPSSAERSRRVSVAAARSCWVRFAAQRACRTFAPTRFLKRSKSTSEANRKGPFYCMPLKGMFCIAPPAGQPDIREHCSASGKENVE